MDKAKKYFWSRTFSKDFWEGKLGVKSSKTKHFLPLRCRSQTAHAKKLFISRVFDLQNGPMSLGGQTCPNHYKQMKVNVIIWSHMFLFDFSGLLGSAGRLGASW